MRERHVRWLIRALLAHWGTGHRLNDCSRRSLDERNRFLVALDDTTRPLERPEDITQAAARLLGEHLGVNRCAYADVEADEDTFNLTGDYNNGVESIVGRYTFEQFGEECLRLMRAGEPYVVVDSETDPRTEKVRASYRLTRIRSVICVPLRKSGRFVAAMAVHQITPRDWHVDEVELVQLVASRCWESIERTRVLRELRESDARELAERKRTEAERESLLESERAARAAAERASALKDEFLATLSHELRTPLNAILGWTHVLQVRTGNAEPFREALEVIARNARAQAQIVDDLLDMNRIMAGRLRLEVHQTDLGSVVSQALDSLRPAADARGVRLEAILDPQAGPVSGDPGRLQQVFWNLVSNGIKFTPRGGWVQVLLRQVRSHLEVAVSDSGEGIDAGFLPYVFDRFRQADASTTRRHGGLGLGLAISKQLVELHGGTLRAHSKGRLQGSTFTVVLPRSAVQESLTDSEEREHPRIPATGVSLADGVLLEGVRVLMVDDEADARGLVRQVLETRGAKVVTAASAGEAYAALTTTPFDVLLSDIGMPGEDGYALIRRVRQLGAAQGGSIPAVALTAYARAEDRVRAMLAGFQMHVAKPVEAAELITVVASLTARTPNRH